MSKYFILIYSEKSFEDIDLWLKDIKENSSPDIKIFLIGNKADLEEKRKITKEQAEKFKKDYDLEFFTETSAKTGQNIIDIFYRAATILYADYVKQRAKVVKVREKSIKIEDKKKKKDKKGCCN